MKIFRLILAIIGTFLTLVIIGANLVPVILFFEEMSVVTLLFSIIFFPLSYFSVFGATQIWKVIVKDFKLKKVVDK